MKPQLTLYTRPDCCLCDDMKRIIGEVAGRTPLDLHEIDVDSAPELREQLGSEVPVLFIDGRKAFKYAVTARDLQKRLSRRHRFGERVARKILRRSRVTAQ
jgi:glutaredoxin